jgi:hypothetical protein
VPSGRSRLMGVVGGRVVRRRRLVWRAPRRFRCRRRRSPRAVTLRRSPSGGVDDAVELRRRWLVFRELVSTTGLEAGPLATVARTRALKPRRFARELVWLISNDAPCWRGSGGKLWRYWVGGRVGPVERGASRSMTCLTGRWRPSTVVTGQPRRHWVYSAQHPRLPRQDALKVLRHDVSSDTEFRERFNREADLAATLWNRCMRP